VSLSLSMVQKLRKPRVTFPHAASRVTVRNTGPTEALDRFCGIGLRANSRALVSLERTWPTSMDSTVELRLSPEIGVILASNQGPSRNHVIARIGTTFLLNGDQGCSRGLPGL
jgi:hypothetical protein